MPRCKSLLLGLLCLLTACHQAVTPVQSEEHAHYFRLTDTLGLTRLDILDPWQEGQLAQRFWLCHDSAAIVPADGIRLQVPLHRVAAMSATHVGFLWALDAEDCLVGMATPELVYHQPEQPVVSLGDGLQLPLEQLVRLAPDLLMMSHYSADHSQSDRAIAAGIPVLPMAEWMEQHPLARAEWIRVLGALMDCQSVADSIWAVVCEAYHAEQAKAATQTQRRSIFSGASFRGTWYVPSGKTYMGQLFADAGADYAFANRTDAGSIPLTMERALRAFESADVWVGCPAHSLAELRKLDDKHTWLQAYQSGEVYHFDKRSTPAGANDFWELGTVHPEYLLRDIRYALYPTSDSDYTPVFLQKLQ